MGRSATAVAPCVGQPEPRIERSSHERRVRDGTPKLYAVALIAGAYSESVLHDNLMGFRHCCRRHSNSPEEASWLGAG